MGDVIRFPTGRRPPGTVHSALVQEFGKYLEPRRAEVLANHIDADLAKLLELTREPVPWERSAIQNFVQRYYEAAAQGVLAAAQAALMTAASNRP